MCLVVRDCSPMRGRAALYLFDFVPHLIYNIWQLVRTSGRAPSFFVGNCAGAHLPLRSITCCPSGGHHLHAVAVAKIEMHIAGLVSA